MAVVLGVNAGFVLSAPVDNPAGTAFVIDTRAYAVRHTAPADMAKISKVGWWCDNATEESNFEVGLYSNDVANAVPEALLFSAKVNAKGTTAGWKTVTVNWTIVPGTIYWIAVQLDDTATTTNTDYSSGGYYTNETVNTLSNPWPHATPAGALTFAVYALVETGTEYVDIAGIIVGTSSLSGTLTIADTIDIAGTITGVSSVGGVLGAELILSPNWQVDTFKNIKRLIVIGNDSLYFEDI